MKIGIAKPRKVVKKEEELPTIEWTIAALRSYIEKHPSPLPYLHYLAEGFKNCCALTVGYSFPLDEDLRGYGDDVLRALFALRIKSNGYAPHVIIALGAHQDRAEKILAAIGFKEIDRFRNPLHNSTVTLWRAKVTRN